MRMDNSLVVFWKSFHVLLRFLVKNAKNKTFLKLNVFLVKCFIKLTRRRLQTGLAILETSNIWAMI